MEKPEYKDYSLFEGPSEEERTEALRKYRDARRRPASSPMTGGGNRTFGTPRKGKNTHGRIEGVAIR